MLHARLSITRDDVVAPVSPRIFGSFVEHMGRAVYTGIYEPGHPTANAEGFREDVLALVRELNPSLIRYPGGNFVSGFRWEDSVGPRDARPVRLDVAWHSIETNEVGLHEFAAWAETAGVEMMQAVNLGTRGVAEAAALLEYANHPGGTTLSDERRTNGRSEPFGIRVWCLGNEMDGPWQIGHKTAEEYGRLAAETARVMKWVDPTIELVVAGSSNAEMPTFGSWERTVLGHTIDLVDHISLHAYYEEKPGDLGSFLASGVGLDRFIGDVAAIIDEVAAERGVDRFIGVSVDEWNVWYQTRFNEVDKEDLLTGDWNAHPRLIEDEYNVSDAVVVGSLLISLLRNSDRVSMANLAQLVNVIAPIRSEPGGPAWRQTTFFPFALTAGAARGDVLATTIHSDTYSTVAYGTVNLADAAATATDEEIVLYLVNRSETAPLTLAVDLAGARARAVLSAQSVHAPDGGDRFSTNNADHPEAVVPAKLDEVTLSEDGDAVTVVLPALSWSIVRLAARSDA
ncbi:MULTISPECIES: alpha-N-arabinofuranosidase [unclassified Cryobacterium]|uniref:arabinosylfuranosidase ArfA n=1 Tax=unclassified Cryobacterium TaxID=2649013 RepID=UPI002AB4E463|nr:MULTISPECIES: alpha-L-arabinofuranosidase C-terminal domain-containing protein [unclassified Cryobacterium]MDY7541587.1 alpha-L-arabinofuranosidase C-terminal domain-containing protein [Cryobacterium sp. 5B3]MEA9998060.1 alpha-L-arabinofuranosidase C-terminal domain-containing protein [Cryobacterium sp. RTS3]MEB0265545.1 alpha-L-arabinofuranosidase C-terminal domain-containing protein [Cryobacterium sp. 10I5]MEB0275341.1 alpha-L-arabinofuranosidase C-terminal domain-containing protein [Cryob